MSKIKSNIGKMFVYILGFLFTHTAWAKTYELDVFETAYGMPQPDRGPEKTIIETTVEFVKTDTVETAIALVAVILGIFLIAKRLIIAKKKNNKNI